MNYVKQAILTYTHTHIKSDSKSNRLKFLFPQNGYNIRIKAFHILNAPPFCDVFVSLLKRVFKSKLAARVSNFNRKHFPFVLSFVISICIRSFEWMCNDFFFVSSSSSSARSSQSLLTFIVILMIQLLWFLSRADWKLLTGVSNNMCIYFHTHTHTHTHIYIYIPSPLAKNI